MSEVIVFTDTNGFLQLRDLKDVPWRELFPSATRVSIMVARPVIEELDHHKVSTNARRRNRARAALKMIDKASASADRTIELRQKPLIVTLTVLKRMKPDWKALPDLDETALDDQLVAAALTYGQGAVLLSHDSGPRISARDVGLTAYDPPESWLLPVEQSDDQRRIGKLESELKQALTRSPKLEVSFPQSEGGSPITLHRYILSPLRQQDIDSLSYSYINDNPRKEIRVTAHPFGSNVENARGFTQYDASKYYSDYEQFRLDVHDYFQGLHERLARLAGVPRLQFSVANRGSGSASGLVVKMTIEGDFDLVVDRDAIAGSLDLPPIPVARMASQDRLSAITSGLLRPAHLREPVDPTAMKWIERPKIGDSFGSYGCQDFRPDETFHDEIFLWPHAVPATGHMTVIAGAQHMPAVTASIRVVIEDRAVGWAEPEVLAMLPPDVRSRIEATPTLMS